MNKCVCSKQTLPLDLNFVTCENQQLKLHSIILWLGMGSKTYVGAFLTTDVNSWISKFYQKVDSVAFGS